MELIFALVKMIEYFFVAPVWWLSKYLAGFVFPYEGDSSHTMLALSLATMMVIGVIFAGIIWLK